MSENDTGPSRTATGDSASPKIDLKATITASGDIDYASMDDLANKFCAQCTEIVAFLRTGGSAQPDSPEASTQTYNASEENDHELPSKSANDYWSSISQRTFVVRDTHPNDDSINYSDVLPQYRNLVRARDNDDLARKMCRLCQILREEVRNVLASKGVEDSGVASHGDEGLRLVFEITAFYSSLNHMRLLKAKPDSHQPFATVNYPPNLVVANSEKDLWQSIQYWLHTCSLHSHAKSTSSSWHPTRLVHIKPDGSAYLDTFEFDSKCDSAPIVYLTLSHCWGELVPFKLLSSNYNTVRDRIDITLLSKNFRDAISVVVKLGSEYIWIDSLCIIQDSQADWDFESSQMAMVYSNSHCNIMATSARDGSEGLFLDRVQRLVAAGIPMSINGQSQLLYFGSFWKQDVERQPLLSRSWVQQERILPPRALHFTKRGVYFECKAMIGNKFFPGNVGVPIFSTEIQQRSEEQMLHDFDHKWALVIDKYSACDLTLESDKLVAIGGLAKSLLSNMGRSMIDMRQKYLAGLWLPLIESQLLWHRNFHHGSSNGGLRAPASYIAPSWSWASTIGPCTLLKHTCHAKSLVQILDISVESATDNEFGAVVSGELIVQARLGQVVFYPAVTDIAGYGRVSISGRPQDDSSGTDLRLNDDFWLPQTLDRSGQEQEERGGNGKPIFLYLLPILNDGYVIVGLGLRPILCTQSPVRFRRYGRFHSCTDPVPTLDSPFYQDTFAALDKHRNEHGIEYVEVEKDIFKYDVVII